MLIVDFLTNTKRCKLVTKCLQVLVEPFSSSFENKGDIINVSSVKNQAIFVIPKRHNDILKFFFSKAKRKVGKWRGTRRAHCRAFLLVKELVLELEIVAGYDLTNSLKSYQADMIWFTPKPYRAESWYDLKS